ncbi:MAG TPA: AgmX/PglI C-terminal domain-containing protein [Kofleriaceae bacterium]|nr:AgmX/PglI C-terminal domain-containing protein [Kofleriaceae bacterium]
MRAIETAMVLVLAAVGAAACGGSKPATHTEAEGGGGDTAGGGGDEGGDPNLVDVTRMDEIKQALDRKRVAAARCLADVVNAGKIDKNAKGHVALGFVIGTDGKATGVKVLEDSLSSPDLEQCVIAKVQAIDFGALPKSLDWSYTFAFESM